MSSELVERLRGIYRILITDGLGPAGGEEPDNPNEFVRKFDTPPIQHKAAAHIEALEAENARLAAALEPFANAAKAYLIEELDDDYRPDWSPFIPYGAYRAARRAREGGNADG